MSEVNAVNAYSKIPFRAAEGQQSSSSSSPFIPSLLVGGATLGGVKMFAPGSTLEKGMDQDTFYSTLKEGKDVPFKKELEGEQKTTYENAKTAAKAEAPATEETPKTGTTEAPKATEAPKTTPAPATTGTARPEVEVLAEHKFNQAKLDHFTTLNVIDSQKGLSSTIQEVIDDYNKSYVNTTPVTDPKELRKLNLELKAKESAIDSHKLTLKNKKVSEVAKQTARDEIARLQSEVGEINQRTKSETELKDIYAKRMKAEADAKVKQLTEEIKDLTIAETDANKASTKASDELKTAIRKNKSKEEIAKLQEIANEKELASTQASYKKNIAVKEQSFHSDLSKALNTPTTGVPVNATREAELNKLYKKQIRTINPEGTKGSLYDLANEPKTGSRALAEEAFNKMKKTQKNLGEYTANAEEFKKIFAEGTTTAADASKTATKAATEGAEAAKKEVPEFAKKAYESLKEVKLKSSWMKAGLWGAGALAATYIVAKMAGGGSKTEQA